MSDPWSGGTGGGTGSGGTSVGPIIPPGMGSGGTSVSGDMGSGAMSTGQGDGSFTASAGALLQGAGEVVEADPRGAGGFDLIARVFRDVGGLRTDVNNLKQRV